MRILSHHNLLIISLLTCTSICYLMSEDPEEMDLLNKLIKEIEQMESSTQKTPDEQLTPSESQDAYKSNYDDYTQSPSEEREPKQEQPEQFVKKDARTLFLDPEEHEITRSGHSPKVRPTKDSILAFIHFSNEFSETARNVNNKLEISQDLHPKFKESKFREFRQELETTVSFIDLIKDKGIYCASFLKADKNKKSSDYGEKSSNTKKIRQSFLDALKKLQDLNANLPQSNGDKEDSVKLIQQLAAQKPKPTFPTYKLLAPSKKTLSQEGENALPTPKTATKNVTTTNQETTKKK